MFACGILMAFCEIFYGYLSKWRIGLIAWIKNKRNQKIRIENLLNKLILIFLQIKKKNKND